MFCGKNKHHIYVYPVLHVLYFILVMGFLYGGHIFVFDICKDNLWLVRGQPEFQQYYLCTEENESLIDTNDTTKRHGNCSKIDLNSNNSELIGNGRIFQQSLQVKKQLSRVGRERCRENV